MEREYSEVYSPNVFVITIVLPRERESEIDASYVTVGIDVWRQAHQWNSSALREGNKGVILNISFCVYECFCFYSELLFLNSTVFRNVTDLHRIL